MKRGISHTIAFIAGITLGTVLCMALGFYLVHKEIGGALIGPRIFGDIKIMPGELPTGQKTLNLQRQGDENCFIIAIQDSNGITESVGMVNKTNQCVSMLQSLQIPGEWWYSYGGSLAGEKITGEIFLDLNFDGQFDTKYFVDKGGEKARWIFLDGDWHKVIGVNHWLARDESAFFRFDPNSGWLQNDANLPDKPDTNGQKEL